MIRVLMRGLSPSVREDLQRILESEPDFQIVRRMFDQAGGVREEATQRDIIVSEVESEEESFRESHEVSAGAGALVLLTDSVTPRWMSDALAAGASAVLPRDSLPEDLVAALRAVAAGFVVIHPDFTSVVFSGTHTAPPLSPPLESLTPREQEVLERMADGLSNKEIAVQLSISEHTVKFHIASILSKLGATSRTEAVTLAIRQGLLLL